MVVKDGDESHGTICKNSPYVNKSKLGFPLTKTFQKEPSKTTDSMVKSAKNHQLNKHKYRKELVEVCGFVGGEIRRQLLRKAWKYESDHSNHVEHRVFIFTPAV